MSSINNRSHVNHLSYNANAPKKAIYRIQSQTNAERSKFIIDTFVSFFEDGIRDNPKAFHTRFCKMTATPFSFYRGSAVLLYQDLKYIYSFCKQSKDDFALTLKHTTGTISKLLNETRLKSHVEHLNKMTFIEDYNREFIRSKYILSVDNVIHEQLIGAFQQCSETIPDNKKPMHPNFNHKEVTYEPVHVSQDSCSIDTSRFVSF
ncbi:unnamed protein product [Rotaria magnacalcarata]|uniref:Uncharacterized protein n=1 Tax=Rotaria magnacalcarata TaxID=392030 RepID=A0A815Z6S1_9BILA|nr:unnamed protein product [Rotaria magnacalcarata]CAF1933377.1 unnamed protein product [Rotaria magnacalcarata]